jgi:hypothetical protein
MPFGQAGQIRFYTFNLLNREGIFHAVVTRNEGVSPAPWNSLNLGGSGGDDRARILKNRHLVFQAFEINNDSIFDVWQVHGNQVICTDGPRRAGVPHQKADAIITNNQNIKLLMLFADCVPILLFDPVRKVVGIVHAGWKGTALKVAAKTVETMCNCYATQPADILAAIGPSIGPDHYSVGNEVVLSFDTAYGLEARRFIRGRDGAVKLNLWEANHYILEQAGVKQIEVSEICTACHLEDWYSHRVENAVTGRFGVIIGLRQ